MTQRKKADAERPRSELDFERGDTRDGRIGDPKPAREVKEEFPGRREREAGTTGGETPDQHDTADDMTPDTLLDSEPSHTPRAHATDPNMVEPHEAQVRADAQARRGSKR